MPRAQTSIALVKDSDAMAVLINNSHSIELALRRVTLWRCADPQNSHHVSMRLQQCGWSAGSRDYCRELGSTPPTEISLDLGRFAKQISPNLFTQNFGPPQHRPDRGLDRLGFVN